MLARTSDLCGMIHPWHDISPGTNAPQRVNAIIEIPKDSKGKYELHKESGLLMLDRVLFSAVHYPANYGFIPGTYCDDKDPLDILVLTSLTLPHLCLVEATVIGVMRMVDQGEADDKVIAVATHDESVNHIADISQLAPHTTVQIRRFFEDYKKLEHKEVVVENFLGRNEAQRIVQESIALYGSTFGKQKS
ncbi:MAG: inorganic diphosphatase [Flavobacteriales bacterium]|nr:inorganic diphosphatase [Flavobacteriales bacterium]